MNFFITFLIFMIILFLYVHINDQYKKSEDLEIYEMDYISNSELQTGQVVGKIIFFSVPFLNELMDCTI